MTDSTDNEKYFTQAVAELGEKQPVIASCAIFNADGVKIVDKGTTINLGLYERLMRHKLSAPIESCVSSRNTVTGKSLRISAEVILNEIPFFARMTPDGKSRNLLLDAIETMALPAPIAFQLTVARDVHPEIYLQLIRTALTAAWLTKTPLLSRFDVNIASAAGMLHDIGMLHVDPLLLSPEHTLNSAQQRQLYSHPLVSTKLIERHHQYPRAVVRAVSEHHEYMDGSGYPRHLVGDAISPLGKLLSLAKVVAAMFSPDRDAPELRLSVLLRMNTHRYDNTLALQIIGLRQSPGDSMTTKLEHLSNPMQLLLNIDEALGQWPVDLSTNPNLSSARREGLALVAVQLQKIQRALAQVGAAPNQLAYLGSETLDNNLLNEMTLITREAGWQLRTAARQTRSRWRAIPGETYPAALQAWLDGVDAVIAKIGGFETMDKVSAETA
ncbi:MAG: HD domain-containing phosphohydrolase [Rhodoferax sp.]|nr:HD domain-containing phosphohydrolase [Rhodoferax sp.]